MSASAFSLAKHAAAAFSKDKPRSSITEWVDILTSASYADEVYDGCLSASLSDPIHHSSYLQSIPELIESIDLQASGPAEASRAIRKKIKHGSSHQQYRALVILNALVENSGQKFQSTFADGQLTDALKNLATDPTTDPKVKKKVLAVLGSWSRQFEDDRSAAAIAGLYRQVKPAEPPRRSAVEREQLAEREREAEQKRKEKKETKRKAKEERLKLEEEARRKKAAPWTTPRTTNTARKPFDFEQEKAQVLTSIASASSAANNLANAITLVNTENDSLLTNERVQECLLKAKQSRKTIVRYIQLVEDEEIIGTLIETNDRIITALESYSKLSKPNVSEQDVEEVRQGLEAAEIAGSEIQKLQDKQRAAVQRAVRRYSRTEDDALGSTSVHPDLHDLSFGALGPEQRCAGPSTSRPLTLNHLDRNLQPPIRPTTHSSDDDQIYRGGSLSDFSDYESSDEEIHRRAGPSSDLHPRKAYVHVSDDGGDDDKNAGRHSIEDPFADPFAD
ncbi:hypothetical protein EDB92DRAFT_1406640 [Lactarius akahatsu]|uniref:VHS domain-containing protein n=1 Tax=Lactarius akahatsu TaxID=416441 RepID=A0AAD4LNZ1_9AGAM|nr:hypothetical protein EDB92DRAFT_1406640 [Lactarius akahatsu]